MIIEFDHFEEATLTLELLPLNGTAPVAGSPFPCAQSPDDPLSYRADAGSVSGWHRARWYEGSRLRGSGLVYCSGASARVGAEVFTVSDITSSITAAFTATITQVAAIFAKLPSLGWLAGSSKSTGEIEIDTSGIVIEDITVAGFTSGAIGQLAGVSIGLDLPSVSENQCGFNGYIIAGDSYLGERAWSIPVENYRGIDLEGADEITMVLTRGTDTVHWDFDALRIDDSTYTVTALLTSEDTDIAKGEWLAHLFARFGTETVSLIGPRAKLKVIGV